MKIICIEGPDRVGKNLVIKQLCELFNYDNLTIRHFGKPPKGMSPKETLDFQFNTFYKEANFINHIEEFVDGDEFGYFDNVVIWNRSHLGEYVYSQMYRGISKKDVLPKLLTFEEWNLVKDNVYLITLIGSPEFILRNEDGESFSQTLEQKAKEVQLFKQIHEASLIKNKRIIKVNNKMKFRDKDIIFGEILELLNIGINKI